MFRPVEEAFRSEVRGILSKDLGTLQALVVEEANADIGRDLVFAFAEGGDAVMGDGVRMWHFGAERRGRVEAERLLQRRLDKFELSDVGDSDALGAADAVDFLLSIPRQRLLSVSLGNSTTHAMSFVPGKHLFHLDGPKRWPQNAVALLPVWIHGSSDNQPVRYVRHAKARNDCLQKPLTSKTSFVIFASDTMRFLSPNKETRTTGPFASARRLKAEGSPSGTLMSNRFPVKGHPFETCMPL